MAGKSQVQQQLDELEKVFSKFIERVDKLNDSVQECKVELSEHRRILGEVRTNQALSARDVDEVRRTVEEVNRKGEVAGNRWWMLVPPVIGAIASVTLSALITYLLNRK